MDKRSIKFEIGVQLVPLLGDGMTLALGTGGSYLGERTDGQWQIQYSNKTNAWHYFFL